MKRFKASTDKAENLFHLMNFFTTNELIKFVFQIDTNGNSTEYTITFRFGIINNTKFNNRIKRFKYIHGDVIQFKEIP